MGISYFWSLLIMLIPVTIYLYLGGFKSEVDTDFIQNIAIILIFFILTIFFLSNIPLLRDYTFQSFSFMTILGFFILGLVTPFGSTELWRSVYAAKNTKTAINSIYLAILFLVIIGIFLLIIGFQLKSLFPSISDTDLLLIRGFGILPKGLFGLGIIALFAAIMSSADTYLFTTSAIVVQDFVYKNKFSLKNFKFVLLVISLLGLLLSIFLTDLPDMTLLFASYASIIATILFLSYIKQSKKGIIFGFYLGLIGTTLLAFMGINPLLMIKSLGITFIGYIIGGFYNALFKKRSS
jgi:Na+/pantothenate symporter